MNWCSGATSAQMMACRGDFEMVSSYDMQCKRNPSSTTLLIWRMPTRLRILCSHEAKDVSEAIVPT